LRIKTGKIFVKLRFTGEKLKLKTVILEIKIKKVFNITADIRHARGLAAQFFNT